MRKLVLLVLATVSVYTSSAQFVSPYKYSYSIDIPVSTNAFALLGTSALIGFGFQMPPQSEVQALDRNSINKFDRGATYNHSKAAGYVSDAALYASVALPLLQLINKNARKDFGKVAGISAEVFALNLAFTNLLKETVKRKRPLLYNPDIPIERNMKKDNFKSFFSGHTSTVSAMSFSFAAMYAAYNPHSKLRPMVWSLCAAFPLVTGILRYEAGKHYWTDVIVGYAVGALIGVGVPYLHTIKMPYNRN